MNPENFEIAKLIFPYASQKQEDMARTGGRFVHYSSSEAAFNMIRNREVWMRKSNIMNDFMEFEHGLECLIHVYDGDTGKRFRAALDRIESGLSERLTDYFNSWVPHLRTSTYLTCVSEHLGGDEDKIGRLSMWRAYGGGSGVAVVMNNRPFLSPSDALKAYTSPVLYTDREGFDTEFCRVVDALEGHTDVIASFGADSVVSYMADMLRFAALCTKHPGFIEEREWRIIYNPIHDVSTHLRHEVRVIQGIPQTIYKIPLKDIPEEGFLGAELPELIERIIIGPTDHPWAIREAFIDLLREAGIPDPHTRVFVSDIPLRR